MIECTHDINRPAPHGACCGLCVERHPELKRHLPKELQNIQGDWSAPNQPRVHAVKHYLSPYHHQPIQQGVNAIVTEHRQKYYSQFSSFDIDDAIPLRLVDIVIADNNAYELLNSESGGTIRDSCLFSGPCDVIRGFIALYAHNMLDAQVDIFCSKKEFNVQLLEIRNLYMEE
jgi:hypothetical protein